MVELDVLFESNDLQSFPLSDALKRAYGSSIGFERPRLFANFVSTMDGVGAIPDVDRSSAMISGKNKGDRFVMGLLRACADAVLVGAGTLRAHPTSLWTPENAFPDAADEFAELRRALHMTPAPALAIVTASGKIDPGHRALAGGAMVITTEEGSQRIGKDHGDSLEVVVAGEGRQLSGMQVVSVLRDRGNALILTEGGPTFFGHLLQDGLVDELFLTIADRIAGRDEHEKRSGIVNDATFLPERLARADLLSARRLESYLFLRYALRPLEPAA